jgi:uncharacterized protein YyaL (SSP411 family)
MNDRRQESHRWNRLIHEKSPYLLQHAENPVDWFPWGPEAFQKAREEEKPIFLSIGYSTCHWCHVMAHESFEDEEVARLLNQSFISIKVDREERPDIDHIYMSVCQGLTGRGGWPLSIFMTPEGNPFFAGTYFPKTSRMGMTGFIDLLTRIADLWKNQRDRLLRSAEGIRQALQKGEETIKEEAILDATLLQKAYEELSRAFDPVWGGFGQAPKFPTPHQLNFLLRWARRSGNGHAAFMVEKTLQAMRQGGIFDQIGWGFHRYSVDEKWLVPHFEKMLYDQAMISMAYLEAYQALGKADYAQTAREIFTYVLRDMTAAEGGFYSAEDADSEGQEGRFYLWTAREVRKHLGEDLGGLFCRFYGVTDEGNFEEGTSIPHISRPLEAFARTEKIPLPELIPALQEGREKLFDLRQKRVRPLKDDKILTSWNGLMIAALAKGYQALQEERYREAARRAADFILHRMVEAHGRLARRYRLGHIAHPGFLDDYAFFIWGLIELYEATFEIRYLREAIHLNRIMVEIFGDENQGGFFYTAKDGEPLIARMKDLYDGATPSANSVAAMNLLRLGRLTGDVRLEEMAEGMARRFVPSVAQYLTAYTQFLQFLDFRIGPSWEIVIAADPLQEDARSMVRWIQQAFLPHKVVLLKPPGPPGEELAPIAPYVKGLEPLEGRPTAYLCSKFTCQKPITDLEQLKHTLT